MGLGAALEVVALDVPEKPLPLLTPMTSTTSPAANRRHVERLADLYAVDVVEPELADVADPRQVLQLAERAAWSAGLAVPVPSWTAV